MERRTRCVAIWTGGIPVEPDTVLMAADSVARRGFVRKAGA
jgi:hypothetical protein